MGKAEVAHRWPKGTIQDVWSRHFRFSLAHFAVLARKFLHFSSLVYVPMHSIRNHFEPGTSIRSGPLEIPRNRAKFRLFHVLANYPHPDPAFLL